MQTLLLLHGAIGAKDQMEQLASFLRVDYDVHTIDFPGHGKAPLHASYLSMDLFAGSVMEYMDQHSITSAHIVGYSLGGYVALYLAKQCPARIKSVITIATKFYWDPEVAAKEVKMLDAATLSKKAPDFAAQLASRHEAQDWKVLLKQTANLLEKLGTNNVLTTTDYAGIHQPVLLMLGDRDKMISLQETVDVYLQLPIAELAVLPGTAHPIDKIDPSLILFYIRRFVH